MRVGYFADLHSHSQTVFRCERCDVDGFDESVVANHVHQVHPGIESQPYRSTHQYFQGSSIGMCLLTWNNETTAPATMERLIDEQRRLNSVEAKSKIFWCDNGSTDDTVSALKYQLRGHSVVHKSICLTHNIGQSIARNKMIREALASDCHYILMLDGDILPVPYSVVSMADWLKSNGKYREIGCIGINPQNYAKSSGDPDILQHAPCITDDAIRQYPKIAWTQYGLFRSDIFKDGIMFDEARPFLGEGWGLEDDDLYLQMESKGWQVVNTYMRHVHQRRSGLRQIDPILAAKVYNDRRLYLMAKWGARFDRLANMTMPVL